MSTSEMNPRLCKKVADLKDADLRWRNRVTRSLGVWLIPGVIAGVGTWFIQKPMDRDEILFGGVIGLGFAIWFFGCMLTRMVLPKPAVECPQCGQDWIGSDPSDDWLTWKCCPGCGMTMREDGGLHEKP